MEILYPYSWGKKINLAASALRQLNGGRDGVLPETVDSHLETKMNHKKTGESLIPERLVQPINFLAIQLFTYGKGNGRNVTYQQKTLNILIKGCPHRSSMWKTKNIRPRECKIWGADPVSEIKRPHPRSIDYRCHADAPNIYHPTMSRPNN